MTENNPVDKEVSEKNRCFVCVYCTARSV